MDRMNRAHALGIVALFVVGAAASFTACASKNSGGGAGSPFGPLDSDSGASDSKGGDSRPSSDTGSSVDSGTSIDSGTSFDSGGGGDTGSTTTDTGTCSPVGTLHPPSADAGTSTIYCPFSATDGGVNVFCTGKTEHCCETPASAGTPSTCQALATTCPVAKSIDWGCQDPVADCPSSKPVCCAPGASIGLGGPGCGNFAHTMTGTTCVAVGACTGITMCTSDGECPSGQHCTPFSKGGAQVGGCM